MAQDWTMAEILASEEPDSPPEGFLLLPSVGNFEKLLGALYARRDGDGMRMGFRVSERHVNAHGSCHGGMLAFFVDMAAYAMRIAADLRETSVPTVSLALEYLRPVVAGDWVEAECELVRKGRRLIVSRVTLRVEGRAVVIATSTNIAGARDVPGRENLDHVMGDR